MTAYFRLVGATTSVNTSNEALLVAFRVVSFRFGDTLNLLHHAADLIRNV